MRKYLAGLGLLITLSGCAHYHILVAQPERGTQLQSKRSISAGWGGIREDVVADNCATNALAEVRVKRSFGQGLLALITLGAYQPATVSWHCAKPPVADGEVNLGNSQ